MAEPLRYVSEPHSYWLGPRRLRSVSEVVTAMGIVDLAAVPPEILANAARRGREIHTALRYYLDGEADWRALVTEETAPYVDAAIAFCTETGVEPLVVERPMYDPARYFAGTPDLIARVRGQVAVVDWKAIRSMHAGYGVSTAGYARLAAANGIPIETRLAVQLLPTGQYRVETFTDRHDDAEFLAALFCYERRLARNGG